MVGACPICHREIVVDASAKGPGDHDAAYHVAQAYHTAKAREGGPWLCESCGNAWPCPTRVAYA